jgi:hypothetical protein
MEKDIARFKAQRSIKRQRKKRLQGPEEPHTKQLQKNPDEDPHPCTDPNPPVDHPDTTSTPHHTQALSRTRQTRKHHTKYYIYTSLNPMIPLPLSTASCSTLQIAPTRKHHLPSTTAYDLGVQV